MSGSPEIAAPALHSPGSSKELDALMTFSWVAVWPICWQGLLAPWPSDWTGIRASEKTHCQAAWAAEMGGAWLLLSAHTSLAPTVLCGHLRLAQRPHSTFKCGPCSRPHLRRC